MRTNNVSRRLGVGVATLGLLMVSVIPTGLAFAEPGAEGQPQPVDASTVDGSKKGSLTVHKHERTAENGTEAGNGKEITDEGKKAKLGAPISGVKFCAEKVKTIDLTKNEGWQKAAGLKGDTAAAKNLGLDEKKEITITNGVGKFENLDLGLYLVTECDVTKATKDGKPVSVVPAKPFLVTIPLTDPTDHKTWMYDLHVYPKNAVSGIVKETSDKGITVGEKSTFTLTAKVPKPEKDNKLNKFVVMDVWRHADKLQYLGEAGDLAVTVEGATVDLAKDTDYKVTKRDSEADKSGYVKITFTDAGLKKLGDAAGKADINVKAVLKLKVTGMPENGVLKNWPFLTPSTEYSEEPPNDPENPTPPSGGTPPPPVAGPPVEIRLGKVIIKKYATGDDAKKQLAGAKFKLYYCNDKSKALSVNGVSEWTTEADKDLEITGIQTSDFYNGKPQTDKLQYCLVETEAPAGYEKLAEPIKFYVDSASNGAVAKYNADVPNSPTNGGFNLPLTGSVALIAISIFGVLTIIGGIAIAWRRRQSE